MNFRLRSILPLMGLLVASLPSMASSSFSGDFVTLSSTPTQFSTSLGYVQRLTFRVIPGYCNKVYIGTSTMNISTGTGIIAVLYPNCSGGLNDEYTIEDRSNVNGFDSSQIYLAGGPSGGDPVLWNAVKLGCDQYGCPSASSGNRLGIYSVAAVGNVSSTQAGQIDTSTYGTHAAVISVATLPGHSGKITVGAGPTFYMSTSQPVLNLAHAVLFPWSSGMHAPARFKVEDPTGANTVYTSSWATFAHVNGEYALVTVFKRM